MARKRNRKQATSSPAPPEPGSSSTTAPPSGEAGGLERRLQALVFVLFFLSGATALVYQVTWVRRLILTFGASHEAVGIVLASFMGGLALGGWLFGRWSERERHPLRLYGVLEIAIGLVALVLPTLLRLVDGIYVGAAREVEGVPISLHVMRVVLAVSVLLLPTFLMGGTLPLLTRLVVAGPREFGRRLSQLYGINTTGAVAGTALAGFVLLPALGVRSSEWLAILLNLAIGVVAILLSRRLPALAVSTSAPEPATPRRSKKGARGAESAWALRLAFAGTAVSGAAALALEVTWMRGISIVVGTTTYSFTVMLCAFLVGIGLGSWLHSVRPLETLGVARQLGWVLVTIGVTSLIVCQSIPSLPALSATLNAWLHSGAGGLRVGTTLLVSFAVMLVPCTLMGIAFPLAGRARATLRERHGQAVGELVGLNTLGAIIGSVAAGFILIPKLGLQVGMALAACLNLAYGLLVLGLAAPPRAPRWRLPAGILLSLAALALPFVLPAWDVRALAIHRNNTRGQLVGGEDELDVLYYREGRGSNVSVIEGGGIRAILIDGKSVASDSLTDMQHELLLGHLPVLLHPAPRTAAVVGLGAGITLGSVLAHPSIESVVLVEIEPAVVDGSRLFSHVNDGAVDDPRLTISFQDGRNHLRTSTQLFDVITADPIHPWARGASYLYTGEYYEILGARLAEGGIACQWLPLYELSPENVRSVIATFADSFAHATVWQTAYDAVLIGSNQPLNVDVAGLADRLAVPSVRQQLTQVGLDDPLSLLSELTLDPAGIASCCSDVVRNTDDNLYLEFSSPLSVGSPAVLENIRATNAGRVRLDAVIDDVGPLLPPGWSAERALDDHRWAKSETVEIQVQLTQARGTGSPAFAPIIERLRRTLARVPNHGRARSQLCLALTQQGLRLFQEGRDAEGLNALEQAVAAMPSNALANHELATALVERDRPTDALPYFTAATTHRPRYAHAHANHGATLLQMGRFLEAREKLSRAVSLRPDFVEALHHLGIVLMATGQAREGERSFRRALELDPDLPGLHGNFAMALTRLGRHGEASELLETGLGLQPADAQIQRQLAWLLATAPDAALRDGHRAVSLMQGVQRQVGSSPQVDDTLAAALAETGRLQEAATLADRAAARAQGQGQVGLAAEIRGRAAGYRQGRPHRTAAAR
ncbi:MAG: fused MFS/spermidine synthase [Acidobacteriota bacterium]